MKKLKRDLLIKEVNGKNAQIIWAYTGEVCFIVSPETARALAYDLLTYSNKNKNKFRRTKKMADWVGGLK